jgi:RNA polymerase sigma factor (sigma-70 family)
LLPPEVSGLLEAADRAASEAGWQTFLERHSRLLLHTARALGRDYDAAMEAYAYLLEELRRDDFRRLRAYSTDSRCKFTTWLVVVARRLCLDHLRQRYGRSQGTGSQGQKARAARRRLVDLVADELDVADLPDPTDDSPEARLRATELSRAVSGAVSDLAPGDRLLLKLRFDDGLGAREIGQLMGFATPFHVYRRLNTLLRELRTALARRGVRDSEP